MAKKVSKEKSKVELDTVSVFCRLKPLKDDTELSCIKLISPTVISLTCPNESKVVRKDAHYTFKHIFTSYSSQQEVFDRVAYPLLENLFNGKNGLLFTYGVTGSGKTYTLTGEHYNPGIMPRCIDTIFNSIKSNQLPKFMVKSDRMNGFDVQNANDAKAESLLENKFSKKNKKKGEKLPYTYDGTAIVEINATSMYTVFVTYIEIYNNTVYDLLDESGTKVLQSKILREDSQKNMYVNGVVEVEVKSAGEAYELFNAGHKRKRMGNTLLNAESSRSHSIFNIRLVQLGNVNNSNVLLTDENFLKIGQLSFVDLAGSERCNRTQTTGMRLKEASSINNSLMSLRNCLEILRENQVNNSNRLIPYRESRLTHIFKNYFEGGGKVEMIVCANPTANDFEENMHVMKFAEITQDVKVIKPESRYTPYRKICKAKEANDTPVNKVKTLSHGTKIPYIKLDPENIDDSIASIHNLTKILLSRKRNSVVHNRELNMKEKQLREKICSINQEHNANLIEMKNVQQQFNKMKRKCHRLETKAQELQMLNEMVQCKKESHTDTFTTPPSQRKETHYNKRTLDSQRQKISTVKQDNANFEYNKKMRKHRENTELANTDEKVKRVREMLANSDISVIRAKQKFESLFTESTNKMFTLKGSSRKQIRRSRSVDNVLRRQNSDDISE
ncbi:PREDICTED: kinesin-like protein KIF23 [Nicrophorus vespilloides]|uniref:Kinesin-like protein n=1 Tax=Nicrophorus vespilloides TaxID=110193 RepID=A0ABM1M915_NICVS|nr:PREDICTED: kinesin-like protein KIF23 [Nicrophorus vespilloides]